MALMAPSSTTQQMVVIISTIIHIVATLSGISYMKVIMAISSYFPPRIDCMHGMEMFASFKLN